MLARGFSRETEIWRDIHGRWFLGAEPIEHEKVARSFDSWIDRAPDGRFCLHNAINWAFVRIDGPPYFVRSATVSEDEVLLHLSGGLEESLDPRSLRTGPDGAIWCDVRAGRVPARFDNHAAMKLAPLMEEDEDAHVVFRVGRATYSAVMTDDPIGGWTVEDGHVESAMERVVDSAPEIKP